MRPESIPPEEASGEWLPITWKGNGQDVGDLQGLVQRDNSATLTRWRPNEAERAALAAGAPLEIIIQHYGQPLQPLVAGVSGLWDVVDAETGPYGSHGHWNAVEAAECDC